MGNSSIPKTHTKHYTGQLPPFTAAHDQNTRHWLERFTSCVRQHQHTKKENKRAITNTPWERKTLPNLGVYAQGHGSQLTGGSQTDSCAGRKLCWL